MAGYGSPRPMDMASSPLRSATSPLDLSSMPSAGGIGDIGGMGGAVGAPTSSSLIGSFDTGTNDNGSSEVGY